MMNSAKRNDQNADRNGLALIAIALAFGGLAVAADLMWMAPHASSTPVVVLQQGSAAERTSAETTYYFPSQFTLNAKDNDDQSPSF